MIKHELADLFRQNSVHKKFVINYDSGTITNSDLLMEEFSLEESICSEEELRFGNCEASIIRFPISNVFTSLNGKVLEVSMVLSGQEDKPLKIGKYKVVSDIPTADRKRKDITAYDALYDVINANVADWYNALLPNADSAVTLKQFRDSFFGYFGIEQVEVSLINDDMIVTKTIQPTELSGSLVANAICELNGSFGHINRDGLMDYVFLKERWEGLYPSEDLFPAEDLFPKGDNFHKYYSSDYASGECDYQDYVVKKITGLEIRQAENSIGAFIGTKENPYVVSDNFLTYGKSTEEMTTIAENMFSMIKDIEYCPFTLNTFRGNPCVEVGDGIKIFTGNQIIESYVLNRTMTGIQALHDDFDTRGREYRTAQVNSIEKSLIQLRGKTNTLERNIDETRSEIKDIEQGLSSQITQTAESIESEVRRATAAENFISEKQAELSSQITQTAESISTKVEKGEVISEINQSAEQVKIQASKIALEGTVTANGNVTIGTDGKLTAKNGSFEGVVSASALDVDNQITMKASGLGIQTSERMLWLESLTDMPVGSSAPRLRIADLTRIANFLFYADTLYGKSAMTLYAPSNVFLQNSSGGVGLYAQGFRVQTGSATTYNLGSASNPWGTVYANTGTIQPSDKNLKHDIENVSKKYEDLFFEIKPCTYIYNNGSRTHIGAISQGVEEALEKAGLTAEQFAGFCKDQKTIDVKDEEGNVTEELVFDEDGNPVYVYSLRYNEFIMLNTHMIQKAYKRIDKLENTVSKQQSEIDELKKSVSLLVQKLGGIEHE